MRFFRKIHSFIFGATTIAVGHGRVRQERSAVILLVGRKHVALSPPGARKVAEQLFAWADHAESFGNVMSDMKWIVKVTTNGAVQKAAIEWAEAGLEKTAGDLAAQIDKP